MVRSAAKPSEKLRVLQMQWNTLQNGYEIQSAGKHPASLATLTAHLKHNVANSWPPRLRIAPYTTRATCRAGRHLRYVSYVYTKRTLSPMESRVGEVWMNMVWLPSL